MRVAVLGGGIAGLAAARRLEALAASVVLVEHEDRLGGKLLTEHVDGFVVEGAADSFLSRKERGVGLCEELGLAGELVGRRPENERTFVRRGGELLPLPSGLTGTIPTNLDALAESRLLTPEGAARLAAEVDLPPAAPGGDESIGTFVSRRLGREAYEALVEPLMTGIYGGDGDQLSLEATFPGLQMLELEYGSVIRGLRSQTRSPAPYPPFVTPRGGTGSLVGELVARLERTTFLTGRGACALRSRKAGYDVELGGGEVLEADGVVLAVPAFVAAELLSQVDRELAAELADIEYGSSVVVTLGYRAGDVTHALDGYGYVVPRTERSDVLACTWTSSKWAGRAPPGATLMRVYAGRFGGRDVTADRDEELFELARDELRVVVGIDADPILTRVHRWSRGMPQYLLGHLERLGRIDRLLEAHPGLALAGAAYHGVGIPDCVRSGEDAAHAVVRALAPVAG